VTGIHIATYSLKTVIVFSLKELWLHYALQAVSVCCTSAATVLASCYVTDCSRIMRLVSMRSATLVCTFFVIQAGC
jgi:hypothetical protein